MSDKTDISRRTFLRRASAAVAAIPVVSMTGMSVAKAKPMAEDGHAHNYVADAANADHPDYSEGERCDNCAFWDGNGGCHHADFQGVNVSANGWCDAWVSG
ncbi:high-potential iron-sulfur protein [Thioalkalivibrio sp. ALR17-21]|uniref:high-potential iron-sulfur protein n=1 Tax=Thioalkalivibrio sp. ALR17-21 TaxID=1269813 RepID=UPI000412E08E|nr:high-potential iron-sulfur protein [Thioalkalivibrio sp. ALR17-21]